MSSSSDLYKESGVDIEKGDRLVDWLKADNKALGGFAGVFSLAPFQSYKNPVLVSGTDGVGTKLLLAIEHNLLGGIGQDLVAMCVNDLYTLGSRPLFFLDYYGTGILDENQFKAVLNSIKSACQHCSTALLGGETAELPGLYDKGHFDLAGFVVGIAEKDALLGPHLVKEGDKLFALKASGFHSNGFSLVRKWINDYPQIKKEIPVEEILSPTQLYHQLPELCQKLGTTTIHAMANITGGGISGNLIRVLPSNLSAIINRDKVNLNPMIAKFCELAGQEVWQMETVFNLGVGMVVVVDKDRTQEFSVEAEKAGLSANEIGEVFANQSDNTKVEFQ